MKYHAKQNHKWQVNHSVCKAANYSPSDAACSKQLPSPVVANGNNRWQMPMSAHQFSRPTVNIAYQHILAEMHTQIESKHFSFFVLGAVLK